MGAVWCSGLWFAFGDVEGEVRDARSIYKCVMLSELEKGCGGGPDIEREGPLKKNGYICKKNPDSFSYEAERRSQRWNQSQSQRLSRKSESL